MNDKTETAATPDPGTAAKASDQTEDGPSTSAPLQATHDPQADRPSFIERLTRLFRHRSNGTNIREEIVDALAETGSDADSFSPGERAMLNNILRLREVRVEDVMVPRADIIGVELSTTLGELLALFRTAGHSRMPVYVDDARRSARHGPHPRRAGPHHPSARQEGQGAGKSEPADVQIDLAQVDLKITQHRRTESIRPVLYVPPSMLASDLMSRMQATRTQMALVIDEYGGTDGLVSLEDLVEMVVGDIEDEHDDDEPMITQAGDGVYVVDGKAEIEEVAKVLGEEFSPGEHSEYVDTIGGMIFNALGRVPARGEVVQAIPGFEFHVLDADPRRVKRVRIVHSVKSERRRRAKAEQA
jgi:CBS domain containing-hemolysin-like protein